MGEGRGKKGQKSIEAQDLGKAVGQKRLTHRNGRRAFFSRRRVNPSQNVDPPRAGLREMESARRGFGSSRKGGSVIGGT